MTCRRFGTSLNDGMFEPPRKRVLGMFFSALVVALSVVAVAVAVSVSPPLVGAALAFGEGGGDDDGGDTEDDGGNNPDDDSTRRDNPPPGFHPQLELVPWLAGDWPRDGIEERALRDLLFKIKKVQLRLPAQRRMQLTPFELRQFELWRFSLMVFDLRMFEPWQSDRPFGDLTFSRSQLNMVRDILAKRNRPTINLGAVPDNPFWGLSWELCGRAVSAGTNRIV